MSAVASRPRMGWLSAEAMITRSSLPLTSAPMMGAADTSMTSTWLPIMAATAALVSISGMSTLTPYLSKAPMAGAIHSGQKEPATEPYDTVSLPAVLAAALPAAEAAGLLEAAGLAEAAALADGLALGGAAAEAGAAGLLAAAAGLELAAGAALPPQACSS